MRQSRIQARVCIERADRLLRIIIATKGRLEDERLLRSRWGHLLGVAAVAALEFECHPGLFLLNSIGRLVTILEIQIV